MSLKDACLRRGWLVPLTLGLFVDNVRGTPVRSAAVIAAVVWGSAVLLKNRRRPPLSFAALVFPLWCLAGIFYSVWLTNTLNELTLLFAASALAVAAPLVFADSPEEKIFFSRALVLLGLVRAAVSIFIPPSGGRFLLDPGQWGVSNYSAVPMFLVLGLVAGRSLEGRTWRVAWSALLAATLWLGLRWNAMSALLGLAAGLPLEYAFRRRNLKLFAAAGIVGIAVLALLFSSSAPKRLRYNPDDPNRMERIAIWYDSLACGADRPVAGTALGVYEEYFPRYKSLVGGRTANFAHNEWIQLFCETGLIGLGLGIFLLRGLFYRIRRVGWDFPGAATGLVLILLWSQIYFVFRFDGVLFAGALFTAFFSPPVFAPLGKIGRAAVLVFLGLTVAVSVGQGGAQIIEKWGGVAWDRGVAATALRRFQIASRWNPLDPRLLDHQVECLRRLNRKEETLPLLEKSLALKPRDVWIRRKLAVARLNLVGVDAARDTYRPILDLAPNVGQFRREYEDLSKG